LEDVVDEPALAALSPYLLPLYVDVTARQVRVPSAHIYAYVFIYIYIYVYVYI